MSGDPNAKLWVELRGEIGQLSQKMTSAVGLMAATGSKIEGVTKGISKAVQAAFAVSAVVAIKKFNDVMVDLADQGEVAGSIADSFKKLGGVTSQIDQAKKATLGMVDSFDLMAVATKGMIARGSEFGDSFAKITDLAGRMANALGHDTKEEIQNLSEAISKGASKELKALGFTFTEGASKTEVYRQAIAQLDEQLKRYAPVSDSVSNAHKAFSVALEEGAKKAGIAINSNEDLTKSYREMVDVVESIDWESIGSEAAAFFSTLMGAAKEVLPVLIQWVRDLNAGFQFLFGSGLDTEMKNLEIHINSLADKKEELEKMNEIMPTTERDAQIDQLDKQLTDAAHAYEALQAQQKAFAEGGKDLDPKVGAPIRKIGNDVGEADKKVAELNQKWQDLLGSVQKDQIQQSLESALSNLNPQLFTDNLAALRDNFIESFVAKWADAIKSGVVSEDEVRAQGAMQADIQVAEWQKKWKTGSEAAYKEGIDTWRSLFENAITGVSFNLSDMLKQVAVGFAAELAQSIFGSLSGLKIGSPQDLGGALFKGIFGSLFDSGSGGGLSSLLPGGISGLLGGSQAGGFLTAMGSASSIGPVASGSAYSGMLGASGAGVAGAMPYVAAAVVAGTFLQQHWKQIEGFFGAGVKDPETLARKHFTEALEDMFKKHGLQYFDEQGKPQTVHDFKSRINNDFNDPDWATKFNSSPNHGMFDAVGKGLGAVFGTGDLPLEQVGAMLDKSLGGSLEGLKALIQSTGKSVDDFRDALMQAGKDGSMTWLEVESAITGVEEAMKPGLVAVGAYDDAFANLLNTGAKGQIALNQVKNIGIEAKEAGIKSLDELKARMIADGKFSADQIEALFKAMGQRGVKSIDDLINGPDRLLGQIIADMQAMGVQFTDGFAPATDAIKAVADMPDKIDKELHFIVTADISKDARDYVSKNVDGVDSVQAANNANGAVIKYASGGIVSRPTMFRAGNGLGLMGEAGPEAILPLRRVNGKLGVSMIGGGRNAGGMTIHVYAPGSSPGMEQRIREVLEDMKDGIIENAVGATFDEMRRSGS